MVEPETEVEVRQAAHNVRHWTELRNQAIRKAVVEQGGKLREVAEMAEMSHQAVKYIATGRS